MRYKIKGMEIRSENAAKPSCNASSALVKWLHNREYTQSALDFGCGKLRYTSHLAKKSKHLGIVDSEVQISRNQLIEGKNTTVLKYTKTRWPQCRVHILEKFLVKPSHSYNFILCANVLSAIPCPKVRAKSIRSIFAALRAKGQVLFANQHTNSYFKEVKKRKSTLLHLDGWITNSKSKASYYGILNKDLVTKLITRHGFTVQEAWVEGQTNYVVATKGKS